MSEIKRKLITSKDDNNNCYYVHFKGHEKYVLCIAKEYGTDEEYVIYMYIKTGEWGARPLDMFLSEVDKGKYPDIKQKYRFEQVGKEVAIKAKQMANDMYDIDKKDYGITDICISKHTENPDIYYLLYFDKESKDWYIKSLESLKELANENSR